MSTKYKYFKFRNRFDFSPHRYDIGRPVFHNRALEDNFFLLKIYEIDGSEYNLFYDYQLGFYIKANPENEGFFFNHVYDIVNNRIRHFKRQDPFSSKYESSLEQIQKLEAFLEFLKTINHWHKIQPLESVIAEKDKLIADLNIRIEELEILLAEATKHDAAEKIVIDKGGFPAFIDLIKQLQEQKMPNGNKFVRSQGQSPWYKMIAKYFKHGENDIPSGTAQNYFQSKKNTTSSKYLYVDEKDKLFKIVPKNDQ